MKHHKALFVAFEGIDNSGKTTLIEAVHATFSSVLPVFVTKELTTDVGRLLLSRIAKQDAGTIEKTLLFAADRQERLRHYVSAHLQEKALCIADRWVLSAMAYRTAEDPSVMPYVQAVNSVFPMPDITIVIDTPAAMSLERGAPLHKNNYTKEFLEKVRIRYIELARLMGLVTVDGSPEYEVVKTKILATISAALEDRGWLSKKQSQP